MMKTNNFKVVILCGGRGTRLRGETEFKPKPMVEIGGRPVLWHIMKIYAHYGFKDFILCLGYKGERIKEYFLNYEAMNNDFTLHLGKKNKIEYHSNHSEDGWKVTLVDTGENTQTGARIKKIERYIKEDNFMVTYGDGASDININNLLEFHKLQKRIGSVTGVHPSSRFGELIAKGDKVISFNEKSRTTKGSINGGFFVFSKGIFNYLTDFKDCSLESEPLEKLASDGELSVFKHEGFWQCMDTQRELDLLNDLWAKGNAPWKIW
ncbi:MAG: glucose-1-phosphate cytidylyltransferase [Candidatus Omnitrophota bacterium]